jgi:hypothetical protein
MAQSDLNSMPEGKRQAAPAVTAEANVANLGQSIVDTAAKAAAAAAGVKNAAFIGYDAALDAYSARVDVESLAHKNARNIPADFADADFMRKYDADAEDHGSSGVESFQQSFSTDY